MSRQRLQNRLASLVLDAEGLGDRSGYPVRMSHRGQLDEPGAVGKARGQLAGDPQRQTSLAATAGAREGDKPARGQDVLDLPDFSGSPDKGRLLARNVVTGRPSPRGDPACWHG